jgi:hypothetical protein
VLGYNGQCVVALADNTHELAIGGPINLDCYLLHYLPNAERPVCIVRVVLLPSTSGCIRSGQQVLTQRKTPGGQDQSE